MSTPTPDPILAREREREKEREIVSQKNAAQKEDTLSEVERYSTLL
jgi:hypothetical protein